VNGTVLLKKNERMNHGFTIWRTSSHHYRRRESKAHDRHKICLAPSLKLYKICPATCHGGTWGERRYSSYSFLTSVLDGGGGEVVSITPRPRFTPGERTTGTHWTGGWVGLRVRLDAGVGRKILCVCQGSNPDRPVRSQTLYWLSYRGSCLKLYYFSKYTALKMSALVFWVVMLRKLVQAGRYQRQLWRWRQYVPLHHMLRKWWFHL
jgi:hypothetical protein